MMAETIWAKAVEAKAIARLKAVGAARRCMATHELLRRARKLARIERLARRVA